MDEHKRVIQECVNKVAGSKNSSVIEKDKYDKVVTYLSESASGDSKFRWWVEKKRCYRLLNFAELGLNNVLCVPAVSLSAIPPLLQYFMLNSTEHEFSCSVKSYILI